MSSPLFKKPAKSRSGNIRQRNPSDVIPSTSSPLATFQDVEDESRSKGGPSRRRKDVDEDQDMHSGNGDDQGSGISPMMLAKQRKKDKEKRSKLGGGGVGGGGLSSKSRLSFGVTDESEGNDLSGSSPYDSPNSKAFIPKKSTLSQSVSLQRLALSGAASTSSPSSPLADSLAASQKSSSYLSRYGSTPTRPSSSSLADHDVGEAMLVDEEDDIGASSSGISKAARAKYGSRITDQMDVLDTTAGIPDEARIASAKLARRKALINDVNGSGTGDIRDAITSQDDYVSLGDGRVKVYDEEGRIGGVREDGPHPESRLQREDDEEGEGDEDHAEYTGANESISLTTLANKSAARRLKSEMVQAIDDREAEDVDDEDVQEWEMAQVYAGGGGWRGRADDEGNKKEEKKVYRTAKAPVARPLPTITGASNRLQTSLGLMESSITQRASQIAIIERELTQLDTQEEELRQEVDRVEAKREWMEEFRGWVETLGGFLEEKFPILEEIEKDALRHYTERNGIIGKRRSDDDLDDLALFLGVAPAAEGEDEVEEVDEMGRTRRRMDDSGPQSGMRRARREERQIRRARRRATQSAKIEEEGWSTDSELGEADAEDYQTAQSALMTRVKALSSDVAAEDFRDPVLGLASRFGGWRKLHEEEYTNAYGGLAMVQAWEYWARSEMANWEPSRSPISLDAFRWYHALHDYSRPAAPGQDADMDEEDEPRLGPDGDLVPAMVSSAVTVLITKCVEVGGYDLYSAGQARRLTDLVDMVGEYTGKENSKYKAILRAVLSTFNAQIDSLIEKVSNITQSNASQDPPAFDPATRTSLMSFNHRQIKLVRNLLAWKRYVPMGDLNTLVAKLVSGAMRAGIQKHWDSGGSDLATRVLAVVPPAAISDELRYFLTSGPIMSSGGRSFARR